MIKSYRIWLEIKVVNYLFTPDIVSCFIDSKTQSTFCLKVVFNFIFLSMILCFDQEGKKKVFRVKKKKELELDCHSQS